ncbi:ATP-binding protein [Acidithiobacillus ferrooxidans]|jgi:hypothetical protein|uniref:ATP-binding protein n=1 Tax=Acidithiobacillus ferrooxidans TaxID=920 RepID=UPI0027154B71|nr:ATP-binding protein [Acidithiobacillus ferrooxidans]
MIRARNQPQLSGSGQPLRGGSVNHWHEYLGEPTVADAVLDRLLQSAHRLELEGDSLRRRSDGRDTPKVDPS